MNAKILSSLLSDISNLSSRQLPKENQEQTKNSTLATDYVHNVNVQITFPLIRLQFPSPTGQQPSNFVIEINNLTIGALIAYNSAKVVSTINGIHCNQNKEHYLEQYDI
jgi:hypothetical protein